MSKMVINGPAGKREVKLGPWVPYKEANGATRDLSIGDFKGQMVKWGDELSLKVGTAVYGPFKYVYEVNSMFAKLEAEIV